MAAHTCPDLYHLRLDTLAFLLFVADELQYWGRPTLEQLMSAGKVDEDSRVMVSKYGGKHVAYAFEVSADAWEEHKTKLFKKLMTVRKMLRLAVDTVMLEGHRLEICYHKANEPGMALIMDGRALSVTLDGKAVNLNAKGMPVAWDEKIVGK